MTIPHAIRENMDLISTFRLRPVERESHFWRCGYESGYYDHGYFMGDDW